MKKLLVLASALVLTTPLLAGEAHVRSAAPLVVGAVSHLLLPTSAFANGQYGAVFKTRISVANVTGYRVLDSRRLQHGRGRGRRAELPDPAVRDPHLGQLPGRCPPGQRGRCHRLRQWQHRIPVHRLRPGLRRRSERPVQHRRAVGRRGGDDRLRAAGLRDRDQRGFVRPHEPRLRERFGPRTRRSPPRSTVLPTSISARSPST